ncbi:MAG: hypothetical protein PVJ76_19320 [Gemmatimonadota bacterium]|jgi:hypothetical protein
MNWDAIQAIAELSAAVGVLLSLVYVGLQVRQNTAALQAGTVARTSELMQRTRIRLWGDADAARIWDQAVSGVEVEDSASQLRVRHFMVSLARDHEAVFYQHLSGQLPEPIWQGWVGEMRLVWCSPGGADALASMRVDLLSAPFVEFLDAQIRSTKDSPLLQLRSRWEGAARMRREGTEDSVPPRRGKEWPGDRETDSSREL